MAADVAQRKTGTNIDRLKFKSLTAIAEMGGARVMLLKPQTFMNLSGDAVREAMGFYKLPLDRVVAVSDDFTLALGALRVRRSGSSGGHNGLRDIISKCGGEGFPRVRIGVGAPPESAVDAAEWVLSRFDGADKDVIGGAAERAVGAIEMIISSGVDSAMNAFNRN
jgi:PTH1 family peptidyl-tRNA hydrolase